MNIPKKVSERLSKSVGTFQKVLEAAKHRDVNESDTVTIITDMLASVFGYDKYTDITSEQSIRGTFCDLAVKADNGDVRYLIEVKAIGLSLKENHLRQAVNYGANHGIPWVILTNGTCWDVYRIRFEQPINYELVFGFDFLQLSPRKQDDQGLLYVLCKEGISKDIIEQYHERAQTLNRFVVAALIQSEQVLSILRRELRRLSPDVKAETNEVAALLPEILKRDVVEGEGAERAKRQIQKAAQRALRQARSSKQEEEQSKADFAPVAP